MQLFKAATPGFLFTLAATGLLAVVSFSVPWFKSVYFLRAAISQSGVNGSVTFGVLGYCLDFNNQITCSNASVGWEFNPNTLLGNDLPIQIPNVVVKWITYVLVLHIVALGLSGASAVFGLLAHVRNMTMSCFSSCIAGTAAAVALIAFIFDLVLFFAVRARVNNIQGGSASIGNALWMTLAAWALLFFSGCAYAFGRCCVSKSPSGGSGWRRPRKDSERSDDGGKYDRESDRMRLDAVKAEADRKARQREGPREVGLPAFHEYERTPLRKEEPKQYYEEEVEVIVPYTDRPGREPSRASHRTETSGAGSTGYRPNRNYQPGAPGTRAIDDYYNNTAPTAASLAAANTYPPKPQSQRRPSEHTQYQASVGQPHRQASSHSSGYDPYGQTQRNVPPPVPALPQAYQSQSPPTQPAEPYVAPTQSHSRADPYLAIAAATSGAAAAGYANNRSYSGDNYNHDQYPSSHQQYPSASQQYTQNQGNQDPYAGSSYNPQAAVMSPPQPTHYLDNSNSEYQRYDDGQQQHGYDPYGQQQQRDLYAEQQQPDPYARDPYAQDPYAQQQGYDPYGQQRGYDSYGQQGYDSYANQEYSQQAYSSSAPVAQPQPVPLMPQAQVQEPEPEPRTMVASPERGLVSSPSPMHTPSYTPQPPQNISTAVAVAGPSSGQGHQHNWSITRSEESPSEAPPPQYEAMPGTSGYPVEKRQ